MFLARTLDTATSALRTLCALICRLEYYLVANLFELFINISGAEILSQNDIKPIYERVTMILAIVMVFYVTFQFVKYIVQPDDMTSEEKGAGKIFSKIIIVILLIAFVPTIFSFAYKLQNRIIKQEVLSKVILGKVGIEGSNFGGTFAASTFSLFYYYDEGIWGSDNNGCEGFSCKAIADGNTVSLAENGKMPSITFGLNSAGKHKADHINKEIDMPYINFDGLFAVLVGGFLVYMLVLYCIDVGTRAFQLIFLQVIAPIPIIGYLSPKKDNMFSKWVKQCIATYLDMFVRLALIYFVLLLSDVLRKALDNNSFLVNINSAPNKTLIYIALVLGLLSFAKKAPELLKELFPKTSAASGDLGLKLGNRGPLGRIFGAAAGTVIGAGAGLATGFGQGLRRSRAAEAAGKNKFGQFMAGLGGGLAGATSGTIGGAGRGLVSGSKKGNVFKNSLEGAKGQIKANRQFGNRQEAGYSLGEQMSDRFRGATGMQSKVEILETQKAPIKKQNEAIDKIKSTRKAIDERALDKIENAGAGGAAAQHYLSVKARKEELQKNTKLEDYMLSNGYVKDSSGRFSQADIDKAKVEYGQEIQKVTEEFDDAQKKAIAEYVQTDGKTDGAITAAVEQMEKTIEEHNKGTSKNREIHVENYINNMFNDYLAFSDEVKKHSIKKLEDENTKEIIGIDAAIAREKAKREGSGIGESKK